MIDQGMTDAEIANKIGRTTAIVAKRRVLYKPSEARQLSSDLVEQLHAKPLWATVAKQLSKDELAKFEYQWVSLHEQFAIQGILSTEEISMKDLILIDILCDRNLEDRRSIDVQMEFFEENIKREQGLPLEQRDVESLLIWQDSMNALRAAKEVLAKDYKEYLQRKQAILKDLKGTREQRLKTIEESKKNFFELVKLLDEPESRRKEGEALMVLKLAVANQKERLQQPYKFADGKTDLPLLTPERLHDIDVNTKNTEK